MPNPTDVLAEDYFDEAEWRALADYTPRAVAEVRVRINKLCVHVTYDRISEDPNWWIGEPCRIAREAMRVFASAVDHSLVCPELLQEIERSLKE